MFSEQATGGGAQKAQLEERLLLLQYDVSKIEICMWCCLDSLREAEHINLCWRKDWNLSCGVRWCAFRPCALAFRSTVIDISVDIGGISSFVEHGRKWFVFQMLLWFGVITFVESVVIDIQPNILQRVQQGSTVSVSETSICRPGFPNYRIVGLKREDGQSNHFLTHEIHQMLLQGWRGPSLDWRRGSHGRERRQCLHFCQACHWAELRRGPKGCAWVSVCVSTRLPVFVFTVPIVSDSLRGTLQGRTSMKRQSD